MHSPRLLEHVASALQEVAEAQLMPRFRELESAAFSGDAERLTRVTARRAEAQLTSPLLTLLPGSHVVGAQAARRAPDLRRKLREGYVWLVDALDGSANFAAGLSPFSMQVALLRDGETLLAWVFAPLTSELALAERGAGAWLAGQRLRSLRNTEEHEQLRGRMLIETLPAKLAQKAQKRSAITGQVQPGIGSTGSEYFSLLRQHSHFTLYWRALPWHHAAGSLLLTEAGGRSARLRGADYRVWDEKNGLLVAGSHELWTEAQRALFSDTAATRPSWSWRPKPSTQSARLRQPNAPLSELWPWQRPALS
jgi:fructose-1,6-bisphosphatase/inositol monophosphatase family enzyme